MSIEVIFRSENVQILLRMKLEIIATSAPSGPEIEGRRPKRTPVTKTRVLRINPQVPTTANFKTELIKMDVSPSRGMSTLKKVHDIVTGLKPEAASRCEYCLYRES